MDAQQLTDRFPQPHRCDRVKSVWFQPDMLNVVDSLAEVGEDSRSNVIDMMLRVALVHIAEEGTRQGIIR